MTKSTTSELETSRGSHRIRSLSVKGGFLDGLRLVTDAHGLAQEALETVHLEPVRVRVSVQVEDGISVSVAKHEVIMALTNILKNAYEAILFQNSDANGGEISIVGERTADGDARITICDNGQGMNVADPSDVRAFVPVRTTKKGYGTGFGLPIAYRYVVAHGGAMSIDSKEGSGTTVIITLPIEVVEGHME